MMMGLRREDSLLIALSWITFSGFTLGFNARIRVNRENAEFLSFQTPSRNRTGILKLIRDPYSENIYAGTLHDLYILNSEKPPALKPVNVSIFDLECQERPEDCEYSISLLKEGRNGNPLFMCKTGTEFTKCCDVSSEHVPVNCTEPWHPSHISEPSLHVGDSLYYTLAIRNNGQTVLSGLYRWSMERPTLPLSTQNEQRYVKILANQGYLPLDGKVYSFYIEKNWDQNPETPVWIPLVSQICLADRGGNKALLHNRWTSMLTARLFCGDEKNHLSYTELLDVAVLEDTEWQNTTIYTLFKNEYNLRAVCVYKMSDILHVFRSNEFTSATDPFSSPRPGECVQNSQALSPALLRFMGNRPELKAWVTPAQNPLLFSHHHYTHLQVDRVESSNSENGYHDVLLMSLDSGKVHKILDQDGKPFIIAEYEPFKTRTHISSMLLDSTTKKLFVSSSSEVIQIDLRNCSMYGNQCQPCVMARDPYCIWDWTECSHNNRSLKQDVNYGNEFICEKDDRTIRKRHTLSIVSEDSIFFLKCPMESQHASYAWYHQGMRRECDLIERDCILLFLKISSMQEGVYECIASENGYNWTVVEKYVLVSSGTDTRTSHVVLTCFLFLIYVIY
ncbi:semaphorin-7A [Silurus meridionalis]|uniref:semaphorin-7A n=1 Tax=Silurus meridionalis TaxID=175797 RepID=UPI001EEACCA1|nr:semaphorin-7A [Silurus meridionalis]